MVQSPDRCLVPLIQDQAALGRGPETHSHVAADSTRLSGRFDAARMRPERRLARTTSGGVPRPAGRTATGDPETRRPRPSPISSKAESPGESKDLRSRGGTCGGLLAVCPAHIIHRDRGALRDADFDLSIVLSPVEGGRAGGAD